ncbi:unnamed protein product [Cochlearia groenlandica]
MSEVSSGEVKEEKQKGRGGSLEKGKSCKGYLYYSSSLKSKSKNPRCVGFPRKLPYVRTEASKEGSTLADFYYGCLGYSAYRTENDWSAIKQTTKTQFPACIGLKLIADTTAISGNTSSAPARVQNRNDAPNSRESPRHQNHKPTPATVTNTENGFVTRFTRNANLVASGVMKNMKKVGNYVRETMDDALRPK